MERLRPWIQLCKFRMVFFILVTVAFGYLFGASQNWSVWELAWCLLGSGLLACACFAWNQAWEADRDALMRRTRGRPIPTGRLGANAATWFGAVCFVLGVLVIVGFVNALSAAVGATIVLLYAFAYTPFKVVSHFNTLVGAIPGAMPPLVGWAAARNQLGPEAWVLFGILFFWQLPHFFSLAWIYREDYRNAGFRMLSLRDADGRACFRQIFLQSAVLLAVSTLPFWMGWAGGAYLAVAGASGGLAVYRGYLLWKLRLLPQAKAVFRLSLLHLPVLLAGMLLDKTATFV